MKRILMMLLAVMLVVSALPMTVLAAPVVTSGDCSKAGDGSVTWKVENGTLTISGSGQMEDYGPCYWLDGEEDYPAGYVPEGLVPWYYCHPTKAVIAADVVSLGSDDSWGGLFWDNAELESFEVEAGNSRYSAYDGCLYVEAHVYTYDRDNNKFDTGRIEHTLFAIPPAKKGRLDIQEGTVDVALYSSWGFLAPCSQLTSIHFPSTWWPNMNNEETMTWAWGHSSYHYTYSTAPIASFSVAEGNPNVKSINGSIYTKDGSALLMTPIMPENREIKVAEGTQRIAVAAFPMEKKQFQYSNDALKIFIPKSVTEIGNGDQYGMDNLMAFDPTGEYHVGTAVIYGYTGTEAERTAKANHITFVDLATYRPPVGGFNDVFEGDYYAESVVWAVEKGIAKGTSKTTFSPKDNCTHAHILTFLWRAAGEPESAAELPFTAKNDWAAKALRWAYEKGMIGSGFNEEANCTSANAVSYIWQAKDKPAASYDGRFTDVAADADYAQAVAWAVDAGVTKGNSKTTFGPNEICIRGRIATFLFRAFAE